MIVRINPLEIEISKKFQGLCKKPYYCHPKGCPNYGKKKGCPPGLSLIDKVLDFDEEIYVIYTSFGVGKFAEGIRKKYPNWTERAIYNPRYWQPKARKFHRLEEEKAFEYVEYIERCPEARGVNITSLMETVGVELEWKWPPEHNLDNLSYIVSIGGFNKHLF